MKTGLHALSWGLPRLGFGVLILVFVPMLAYAGLVAFLVVSQAAASFGT